MEQINFAILSFAHIHAWNYARVLKKLQHANLVAIYDDDFKRLKKASSTFKVEKAYKDYRKLLEREAIDAVIITSENARHAELALASAEAGKHILCEKPIATNLNDSDEMIRTAEKNDVKLQIAFVMRYHPATAEVKKLIEEGSIGNIISITATNHGKYPGEWFGDPILAGGGAIIDHTVHVADLIRWYTNDEVSQVYAEAGENIRPELKVEDNALILLKMKKGIIASIDPSWSRPDEWPFWGDVYLFVVGERGCIVVDAFSQHIQIASKENRKLTYSYYGTDPDEEMIKSFIQVITRDEEPLASGFDGRQALEIALAAYESIKRRKPVKLPLNL